MDNPYKRFGIGFIVDNKKMTKHEANCPRPGPILKDGQDHVFVTMHRFPGRPDADCTDSSVVRRAMARLKMMALHQVAHIRTPYFWVMCV